MSATTGTTPPSGEHTTHLTNLWQRHGATVVAFAIRVLSAVLVFVLQVFLARSMALESYGLFITASTWIIVIAGFSVLGFGESAQRFLPRYILRERWQEAQRFFHFGLAATVGVALCIAFCVAVFAVATWPEENVYRTVVLLIAIGLPFAVADFFLEGVGRAMGWFKLAIVPTYIIQPVLMVGVLIVAVYAGAEISVVLAGSTLIAVTAVLTFAKGVIIARRLRVAAGYPDVARRQSTPSLQPSVWSRHWLRASLPLMAVYGMDDFLVYSDVLLLGLLATPQDVGIYIAAVRCLAIANFIHYAFMLVTARKFSLANSGTDRHALQREVQEASQATFLLTVPAVLITLAAGYPLLRLFGEAFTAAWPVMIILGAGFIVRASIGQAFDLLAVTGHARAIVWISITCLVANVLLSLALIPLFGLIGAAAATSAVMMFRVIGLALATERLTGISSIAFITAPRLARNLP